MKTSRPKATIDANVTSSRRSKATLETDETFDRAIEGHDRNG